MKPIMQLTTKDKWTQINSLKKILGRLPIPQNDKELEILSNYIFGKKLHLSRLFHGSYEVKELYDSYHGSDWISSRGEYDADATFWRRVMGVLRCGGVAGMSYGQFDYGHRQKKRHERWIKSRAGCKALSGVRASFLRLARKDGAGEIKDMISKP